MSLKGADEKGPGSRKSPAPGVLPLEAEGYLPQLDWPAAETMASFWAEVISPFWRKVWALFATQETYWPWFFQGWVVPRGPAQGQSWAIEQPVAGSTTSPVGVKAQTSEPLATPSPSMSPSQALPRPSPS